MFLPQCRFVRSHSIKTGVFLTALFVWSTGHPVIAQESAGTKPVAFVYVSYGPYDAYENKVMAYAAAADGKLTVVAGSPFTANVDELAVTHTYLFGSNTLGSTVDVFRIGTNGALRWVSSTDATQYSDPGCLAPGAIVLDHTGATLYRQQLVGGLCDSTEWLSFRIDKSNGTLQFIGKSGETFLWNNPLSFSGNNDFAYGSACIDFEGNYLDTFAGFARHSDGFIDDMKMSAPTPSAQSSSDFYCRSLAAADPTHHLAVTMTPINLNVEQMDGPTQIGTYAIDGSGNLSTTSTWKNMPATEVGYVHDINMSPSGKLVAVGGQMGLQIFHYNGASPVTHFTDLLTTDTINQVFWDNNNHLYALSVNGNLYVFTAAPNTVTQAPGSPYHLANPRNIIVSARTDSDGDWDND